MKKIILFLTVVIASCLMNYAQDVKLKLTTGQTLVGTLAEASDSTVTIMMGDGENIKPLVVPASKIFSGKLPNNGSILVNDGHIILITQESIRAEKRQKESELYANPHYAIGRALKTSGITALSIGVPCLAAGLATCIVGYTANTSVASMGCAAAAPYLLGAGASLTIIGIPLYIEGKKILEFNMTYSGNSAGIAMNF